MKNCKSGFSGGCAAIRPRGLFSQKSIDLKLTSSFMMVDRKKQVCSSKGGTMMSQFSHRQSTARLRLTNPDGTPAAGKKV